MPTLSMEEKDFAEQPFMFVRRRAARHELAQVLGECFGAVFGFCMKNGVAMAGRPTSRYTISGPGLLLVEAGVPLAAASVAEGDIETGLLQGGPAITAVHAGPYEQLSETLAAMERFAEERKLRPGPLHWESYLTDPAEHPDPGEWRTEVVWPLAR